MLCRRPPTCASCLPVRAVRRDRRGGVPLFRTLPPARPAVHPPTAARPRLWRSRVPLTFCPFAAPALHPLAAPICSPHARKLTGCRTAPPRRTQATCASPAAQEGAPALSARGTERGLRCGRLARARRTDGVFQAVAVCCAFPRLLGRLQRWPVRVCLVGRTRRPPEREAQRLQVVGPEPQGTHDKGGITTRHPEQSSIEK